MSRGERSNSYLTQELSANTVAFISHTSRQTVMLAGAMGGGKVRLPNVNTGRLSGLKNELVCHFKLVVNMVEGGAWDFLYGMDAPAFLKRELIRLDMDGYQ